MIREFIKPKTNQILVKIPNEFIDKNLELLIFPINDAKPSSPKPDLVQLMEKNFLVAKTITISKGIDLDKLMNEMNDALS